MMNKQRAGDKRNTEDTNLPAGRQGTQRATEGIIVSGIARCEILKLSRHI
jgi:hypothetical protein